MKESMTKNRKGLSHFILLLFISLQIFVLSSCGAGDWHYSGLPGDYEIWRINSKTITLVKRTSDTGANSVIPSYVSEVAWDENFILAQRQPTSDSYNASVSYYIVDVNSDEVHGPFTESEFHACAEDLQISLEDFEWSFVLSLKP